MEALRLSNAVWVMMFVALTPVIFTIVESTSSDHELVPVKIKRLSSCSAEIDGKVIDLSTLQRTDGLPRFNVHHGLYSYTFNPCSSYSQPLNGEVFGDNCQQVSMCKIREEKKKKKRLFLYGIGTQRSVIFTARRIKGKNITEVFLTFTGILSMSKKRTHVKLICNKSLVKPTDALFLITSDELKGDINAQLQHACACPGECLSHSTIDSSSVSDNNSTKPHLEVTKTNSTRGKSSSKQSSPRSLVIVLGINIGLLILAVFIGALCYNKRSAIRSYNKLPGPHFHMGGKDSKVEKFPTVGVGNTSSRKAFRDYELDDKKAVFLPVLDNCEIPIGQLDVKQRLGGNIFGDTYKGHFRDTHVAIKCITHGIQYSENHSEVVRRIKEEVSILSKVRHKNIAAMLGMCLEAKFPYIVNQLINGRSVKQYLKNENYISWTQKVRMCIQAADGMTFLHSMKPNPILHRDLRCANLMITPEDVVVVVDFGITTIIQPVREECRKEKCFCMKELSACPPSIRWTAPEILVQATAKDHYTLFTPSCDVYSFGMLLWELMSGLNPFPDIQDEAKVMEVVKVGSRPTMSSDQLIPTKYKDLLMACWDNESAKRPTFKQIVSSLRDAMGEARSLEKRHHHHRNHDNTGSRSSTPVPFTV